MGMERKAQGARGEDQRVGNKNGLAQSRPSTIFRSYGAGKGAEDRGRTFEEQKIRGCDIEKIRNGKGRTERRVGFYVWVTGLVIFGYSVVLESVQFFLPYRTFNPYDIFGNGIGVGAFCLICLAKTTKNFAATNVMNGHE